MGDYPTEAELQKIKNWDIVKDGVDDFIIFIKSIWQYADFGFFSLRKYKNYKLLRLSTAGWSGNEEIISVLQNHLFWLVYWQKSKRGGHYWFKIDNKEKLCNS